MDSSWALLISVVILTVLYYYLKWPYGYWERQKVKCIPGTIPGFGHILPVLLAREGPSSFFTRIYESTRKSSMVGIYFLRTPALLVREPELVKQVLIKDFSSFQNNLFRLDSSIDTFLAKNPFFAWDEEWKEMRSQMVNNMSQKKLKILFRIMHEVSVKFEDYLRKIVEKSANAELEMKNVFLKFTAEVVARTAFGIEGGSFDAKINPLSFTARIEKMLVPSNSTYLRLTLTLYFSKIASIFKVGFMERSLSNFLTSTVANIMHHRKQTGIVVDDLLQMITDASNDSDPKSVAGKISGYFFDAYDTAAVVAAFACFELSYNLEAQEKARLEITEILQNYDGALTYESLKDMKYLDQVVNETIRLHPIIATPYKICTKKVTIEGSDGQSCCLEPGHLVVLPVLGLQTDPEYWKEPHAFDPDRFSDERKNDVIKFTFLPFGEGPRMCAGMRYGIMAIKTLLITVLKDYIIETSPKTGIPIKLDPATPLTSPAEGLWMKLKKIDGK